MATAHEMYSDTPRGQAIGSYDTYAEAQRAVDFLSDEKFPVEQLSIIGTDLRMVERVTGRLTRAKAALAGAASGAWFGLLIGLLLGLFADGSGIVVLLLAGLLYGAAFGALFGFVGHALTGGRRDFTSSSKIVSGRYDVLCAWNAADQAREVLARMPAGA